MGTSSLYSGPKKTRLLPYGYNHNGKYEQEPAGNAPDGTGPIEKDSEGIVPQMEQPVDNVPVGPDGEQFLSPSISWGSARGSLRKARNNRSEDNEKKAIRNYVIALGGHKSAMYHAVTIKTTAKKLFTFFVGTPDNIRKHFEDKRISFEGRTTKEIFYDICRLIAPVPNDLEDSLANMALWETLADVVADPNIDLTLLENFNEELFQLLVGSLVKHYIFDKLIQQTAQTSLKNCDNAAILLNLEKDIKRHIDGIVDRAVPDLIKIGIGPEEFIRVLETLLDLCYQQMEELR